MSRIIIRFVPFCLAGLVACSGSSKQVASPETPASGSEPAAVQCGPTQFVAAHQCYDNSDAACAALSCPAGCLNQETAPAVVVCKD